MSLSVTAEISQDTATPAVAELIAKTQPARLANVLRDPLRGFLRDHLKGLGKNKRGWPSTGFWEEAADATVATAQANGVLLQVNKIGVRQRRYGGTIAPVRAQALAIPISPVSYGHTPAEFPGLFKIVTPNGVYLVQYGQDVSAGEKKRGQKTATKKLYATLGGNAGRRLTASLNFLFKLVGSVDQAADPGVTPTDDEFTAVSWAAITRSLA